MDLKEQARLSHKALRDIDDATLLAAADFYEQSPDGQYDDLAANAIRCFVYQRQLDRKYNIVK